MGKSVVISENDARQGPPRRRDALCSRVRDQRRDFRGCGGSGLFRAISSIELKQVSGRREDDTIV